MYIGNRIITRSHDRFNGDIGHKVTRKTNLHLFRCDACGIEFARDSKHTKRKQLAQGVLHACPSCQGPGFASRASAMRRRALAQDASSDQRLDQLR